MRRALLDQSLPPSRLALLLQVSRLAAEAGLPTYLVGGFARDLLLGRPPGDFDFVVEGAEAGPRLARAAARELGGEVTVHAAFATATWLDPQGAAIDFATARSEIYPEPAALPQVTPGSIAADLGRRDFTINALALRVDGDHYGDVLDPHRGRADLEARVVRALHMRSFEDDPTRILRAVRYEQRLGFHLADETRALIPAAFASLAALTGDRIRHELELIFREPNSAAMLARLDQLSVLRAIHPALHWGASAAVRAGVMAQWPVSDWKLQSLPEPDVSYLALLLDSASRAEAAEALARLNVNRECGEAVPAARGLRIESRRPSEVVAQLDRQSEAAIVAAYVLHEGSRATVHDYLAHWRFVRTETTGDDLIEMGLTPGPLFRRILWELRAARLDGGVTDATGERELIPKLASNNNDQVMAGPVDDPPVNSPLPPAGK